MEKYFWWKTSCDGRPSYFKYAFGNINILDTDAGSTAELLVDILQQLELEKHISSEAATCFYTGIQTDSNMYFNTNTTPKALRAWARLIELWADFRLPITECFKKKNFTQMKLWEQALRNMKEDCNWKLSYTFLSETDLGEIWISLKDTSEYMKGFINEVLINIEGTKIAFLLYPLSSEEQKWSLRSQEWYDVNAICQKFGGGWHLQASGFQKIWNQKDIIWELVGEIKKVLDT